MPGQVFFPSAAPRKVTIQIDNRDGILVAPGSGNVTISSFTGSIEAFTTLASLSDVNLFDNPPANGDILIYNNVTHKYDVKPLTIDIDGGNF